jgi:acyl-CoA thioesterase
VTVVWGDAADLAELLDVRPLGDGRFVSGVRDNPPRPVVEGSQMLGQAVVAAGRMFPERRTVSAWMAFTRPASTGAPVGLALDVLADGRSFTTLGVQVSQDDRLCVAGSMLLGVAAPAIVTHDVEPPAVPGPDGCPPYDMGVTGRDLRIVDDAYTGDPDAPVGPPVLDAWVRFDPGVLADDPPLHAGLLAQFTGHLSIAAALRPHAGIGQAAAHRTLSMAVNAISIAFHHEVRADRWMLYHHHSTSASNGMTHAEGRVHDDVGSLVASFTVDAMVRPFADPSAPVDDRTAL